MCDKWEVRRIGDVAEVFDGPHGTPHKTDAGPWFLSISSLQAGRLALEEPAHLSEEDFARWTRRVTPQSGDVLFSYETRLGEAAIMPAGIRACLGRRMGLLRPWDEINPRFLLYAYLSPQFQAEIYRRTVRGATVDRIPLNELGDWPISIPDRVTQDAIAEVLGALDDKIECNQSIFVMAEGLAITLFADAAKRLEDSASEQRPLSALVDHLPGKHLPREQYSKGGPYAVYGSNSVMGSYSEYLYEGPITVMARIGSNCGALMWSEGSAWVNNNASALRAKPGVDPWVLHRLLQTIDMDPHRAGSGQPFVRVDSLLSAIVTVPPLRHRSLVGGKLRALAGRGEGAGVESRRLADLRDALLPPLLSGELRVRDAAALMEKKVV